MIKLNNHEVVIKHFPNNESLLDGNSIITFLQKQNILTLKFETNEDLINLMFIKKHIDSHNFNSNLEIYYMPYSRMDRSENGNVFTLRYVSEFINYLNFETVRISQPHSDVTMALVNKSGRLKGTMSILEKLLNADRLHGNSWFYFPDAGAQKEFGKSIDSDNILVGHKQRDFNSGRIKSLDIFGSSDLNGEDVIILDDLCCKGYTFLLSAKKLKEMGAGKIYLIVTHCEESIFNGELLDDNNLIEKIYTTDSMVRSKTHNKIKVCEI